MNPQGSECVGLGRIWFVRIRGWKSWFARGASGYLLGPYRSSSDAEMALKEDLKAVSAGDLERNEAERRTGTQNQEYAEDDFPDMATCVEDFDGDAEWCVGPWQGFVRDPHTRAFDAGAELGGRA